MARALRGAGLEPTPAELRFDCCEDDLQAIAATAYPGLYAVSVTTPAGASTALALGEVATYAGTIADWTLTIV